MTRRTSWELEGEAKDCPRHAFSRVARTLKWWLLSSPSFYWQSPTAFIYYILGYTWSYYHLLSQTLLLFSFRSMKSESKTRLPRSRPLSGHRAPMLVSLGLLILLCISYFACSANDNHGKTLRLAWLGSFILPIRGGGFRKQKTVELQDDNLCPQANALIPSKQYDLWQILLKELYEDPFKAEVTSWLSGAVRIPSVFLRP